MLQRMTLCIIVAALAATGCEKTTVEGPNSKSLTLKKPSDTTIVRGDTAKVAVVVARSNFTSPVTVDFKDLPSGVSLVDTGGSIEGTERTFVLKASDTAAMVANHAAKVSVMGPDGMAATEELQITVKEK